MATRLNVNLNDDTARALRDLAAEQGTTVTEIVRRAVSVYKFFDDARDEGKSIQLVDRSTQRTTDVQLV